MRADVAAAEIARHARRVVRRSARLAAVDRGAGPLISISPHVSVGGAPWTGVARPDFQFNGAESAGAGGAVAGRDEGGGDAAADEDATVLDEREEGGGAANGCGATGSTASGSLAMNGSVIASFAPQALHMRLRQFGVHGYGQHRSHAPRYVLGCTMKVHFACTCCMRALLNNQYCPTPHAIDPRGLGAFPGAARRWRSPGAPGRAAAPGPARPTRRARCRWSPRTTPPTPAAATVRLGGVLCRVLYCVVCKCGILA